MEILSMNEPYKEIKIKDLGREVKLSIAGVIVSKSEKSFVIDDGTGSAVIKYKISLPLNSFCKIFGTLLPQDQGFAVNADAVQDLSSMNQELYRRINKIITP
jgi:hypothetical protein